MDVKERAAFLTAHIKDPVERERKRKSLERALKVVEVEAQEEIAEDDGQYDGVPLRFIEELDKRESVRLDGLVAERSILFEVEDVPVTIETPQDALNRKGRYGYTRLIQAVVDEDLQGTRELLELGADMTQCDNGGMNAMDKAKRNGSKAIIALLHEFGG